MCVCVCVCVCVCYKYKCLTKSKNKDSALTLRKSIVESPYNYFGQSVAIAMGRSRNGMTTQC